MTAGEMENRFAELRQSWAMGRINRDEFQRAVASLRYRAADGVWYQIDAHDGAWLRWNGRTWARLEAGSARPSARPAGGSAAVATAAAVAVPTDFGPLIRFIGRQTARRFVKRLPLTILIVAGLFVLNMYIIAYKNDGYGKFKPRDRALGLGMNFVSGSLSGGLVLGVVMTVGIGFLVNAVRRGPSKAMGELAKLPQDIARYFSEAGALALSGLAGGAGIAMLLGCLINGYANLAMAVGMGAMLRSGGGRVIALLIRAAWASTYGTVQGARDKSFTLQAGYVAMVGGSLGFVLKSTLSAGVGFVGGVGLLILALVLATQSRAQGGRALSSLLLSMALLNPFALVPDLCAHDGGRWETGGTFSDWIKTEGAQQIGRIAATHAAATGAVAGAVAAAAGAVASAAGAAGAGAAGQAAGGSIAGGGSGGDMTAEEREAERERDRARREEEERMRRWEEQNERDRNRRRQQREDKLRRDGFEWNEERQAWVPGEHHQSQVEQRRRDQAERLNDFIERNVDDPVRADFLEGVVDRVTQGGGDMDRLGDAIKDNTVGADQQRSIGDSEAAQAEAEELQDRQEYVEDVRDWSQRANRTIGRFVPGAGQIINTVQGGAYGGIEGYDKDGIRGALSQAAADAADEMVEQNTGIQNAGSTLRNQFYCANCGAHMPPGLTLCASCGVERTGGSPLERFTNDLVYTQVQQYDPRHHINQIRNIKNLGDAFDAAEDLYDAGRDTLDHARDAADFVRGQDTHHNVDDADLPTIHGPVPDAPDSPRQPRGDDGADVRDSQPTYSGADDDDPGRRRQPLTPEGEESSGAGLIPVTPGGADADQLPRSPTPEGLEPPRLDGGQPDADPTGGQDFLDIPRDQLRDPTLIKVQDYTREHGDFPEARGDDADHPRGPDDQEGARRPAEAAEGSDGGEDDSGGDRPTISDERIRDILSGMEGTGDDTSLEVLDPSGTPSTHDSLTGDSSDERRSRAEQWDFHQAEGDGFRPMGASEGGEDHTPGSVHIKVRQLEPGESYSRDDIIVEGAEDRFRDMPAEARQREVEKIKDRFLEQNPTAPERSTPQDDSDPPARVYDLDEGKASDRPSDPRGDEGDRPHPGEEPPADGQPPTAARDDETSPEPPTAARDDEASPEPPARQEPDRGTKGRIGEALANRFAEEQGWQPVLDPQHSQLSNYGEPGGHGFDGVHRDGDRYVVVEAKYGSSRESTHSEIQQYSADGTPLTHEDGSPVMGTYVQGSRDWMYNVIDRMRSGSAHDQDVAGELANAMKEGKVDYVLFNPVPVETEHGGGYDCTWQRGTPQPGATTHFRQDEGVYSPRWRIQTPPDSGPEEG